MLNHPLPHNSTMVSCGRPDPAALTPHPAAAEVGAAPVLRLPSTLRAARPLHRRRAASALQRQPQARSCRSRLAAAHPGADGNKHPQPSHLVQAAADPRLSGGASAGSGAVGHGSEQPRPRRLPELPESEPPRNHKWQKKMTPL
ncbi:hypothetical protein SETIT_2G138600v2 [Setaria italica]|uniref:Uncharacterized protein n=2 Tax=Setaria TaxID=4554 RepID=A0A368PYY4_SETIT|nr:hypothetical protein SETIT_2G138600v2 [Setaria italica]TKW32027.1 hypothetical protein SEVIR_2G144100v2 [Setaria viridis]